MTIYLIGRSDRGLAWQKENRPDQPVARITHPAAVRGRQITAADRIVWLGGLNRGSEAHIWVELGVAIGHTGRRLVDMVEVASEPGGGTDRGKTYIGIFDTDGYTLRCHGCLRAIARCTCG